MANNYTLFSVEVPGVTKKERDWLKQLLSLPEDFNEWDDDKQKAYCTERGIAEPDYWPDVSVEWGPEEEPYVLFYSEECNNVDNLCDILQAFLKEWRPKDHIEVEWAFTCSKMRPGEFGGGAAFITAKSQKFITGSHWLMKERERWLKAKRKRLKQK